MNKQQILDAIVRMPNDVSIEQAIETLELLRKIEIGLRQVEAGQLVSHEEVEARFLGMKAASG